LLWSNAYKGESVFARKLAIIIYKPQEGTQLGNISRRRGLHNPCNFGIGRTQTFGIDHMAQIVNRWE
jgi:hypothetical protein